MNAPYDVESQYVSYLTTNTTRYVEMLVSIGHELVSFSFALFFMLSIFKLMFLNIVSAYFSPEKWIFKYLRTMYFGVVISYVMIHIYAKYTVYTVYINIFTVNLFLKKLGS